MIRQIEISNYKSVSHLEIDLGRLNVFIGENGSGKTSVLEAIAFGSAASQRKLENEFLASRGVRVLEPELMKSAFEEKTVAEQINLNFTNTGNEKLGFQINNQNVFPFSWFTNHNYGNLDIEKKITEDLDPEFNEKLGSEIRGSQEFMNILLEKTLKIKDWYISNFQLQQFLIYAPENFFLRRFEEEGQIKPLGIRGEGLFSHLMFLSKENPEIINQISEHLKLIEWFEELSIPNNLLFSEKRINIKDRYLKDNIRFIDQRSSNEGFLYILFYITLFLSKYTPKFFSIDNIDNSLNPKLCTKLIQTIAKLSSEHNKQVILTTHNPAVLDGLDLNDDEQRLFVIYRNIDGHTKAKRVMPPKSIKGVEAIRLSEAFVRGYLGGLPKNF